MREKTLVLCLLLLVLGLVLSLTACGPKEEQPPTQPQEETVTTPTEEPAPEITNFSWVQMGNTEFSGGYGQVVVSIDRGFLILRQYQANQKLDLERYDVQEDGTVSLDRRRTFPKGRDEPPDFETGIAAAWDEDKLIYFLLGAYEKEQRQWFRAYDLETDSWITTLAGTADRAGNPKWQGAGDALVYVEGEDDAFLYAFVGQSERRATFLCYSIAEDRWEELEMPEGWVYTDDGVSLVWPRDDYLYALQGSGYEDMPTPSFARFRLPDGPWESHPSIPDPVGVNDGGSMAWDGEHYIYAITGGYDEEKRWKKEASGRGFYRYDLERQEWEVLPPLPCPIGKYTGNRLAVMDSFLFLWQGAPGSWERGGKGIWRTELTLQGVTAAKL